jgi:hypothetical protein
MPIVSSEIQTRLSGGSSNSNPATSLGGAKSSTVAPTALFDDVSGAEAAAGQVEYRCVYLHNANGSLVLENGVAWLQANVGGTLAIGAGTAAVNATETATANEATAPAGVTFSSAANEGAAISVGSIPAGQHKSVWVRRTIAPGAVAAAISATIRVKGETQP